MKIARRSFGKAYECQKPWPENCFVQCGDEGVVFTKNGSYRTSFFEAFPDDPNVKTFLRGEGQTVEEAEDKAYAKYQQYHECTCDHNDPASFDARGYENGAGFCCVCSMFKSNILPPTTQCRECGTPSYYSKDKNGDVWCEDCYRDMPEELWTNLTRMLRRVN